MNRGIAGGIAALLLGLTAPMHAQTRVEGGVVVQSGPVTGHVEVGSPAPVVVYREPAREVVVVERIHAPRRHAYRWWKRHGYREVTVYSDGSRYYGRRVRHPGLRALVVYELGGRYYLGDEDGDRYEHRRHEDDED